MTFKTEVYLHGVQIEVLLRSQEMENTFLIDAYSYIQNHETLLKAKFFFEFL